MTTIGTAAGLVPLEGIRGRRFRVTGFRPGGLWPLGGRSDDTRNCASDAFRSRRAGLLLSVSALSLMVGVVPGGVAWAQCIPSTQTITGPSGQVLTNGGSIVITSTGQISPVSGAGVYADTCDATSVNNQGTILGTSASSAIQANAGRTIGTLTNSGTIGTALTGIGNSGGTIDLLTNATGGAISGVQNGIANVIAPTTGAAAVINTLSNSGNLSGETYAIYNTGTVGSLSNSGTISGTIYGVFNSRDNPTTSVHVGSIGTLTNNGSIVGQTALGNIGSVGTLSNNGVISGTSLGVITIGSITALNNNAGGSIVGTAGPGLVNQGGIGTLGNAGSISGASYGLVNTGSIGALTNSGTITGSQAAILNAGVIGGGATGISNTGTVGVLSNSGTISGTSNAISSNGILGSIDNTGTIAGNISVSGQGLAVTGGSFGAFGTLTGGTMTVSGGNVAFAGGTHLDDSINVGTGTVINGGTLQLAASHTIVGNYLQQSNALLDVQLSGAAFGDYGNLSITGIATFAGTLAVDLINGATLSAGETIDIANFLSASGDFSGFAFDGASCAGVGTGGWRCAGLTVSEIWSGSQFALRVTSVPEPAPFGVLAAGLTGLGMIRGLRPGYRSRVRQSPA